MASRVAGQTQAHTDFGFSRVVGVGKQILNSVTEHAAVAADRSRFAALPARYLDDVGVTAGDRAAALGFEEPTFEPWRVVASHL